MGQYSIWGQILIMFSDNSTLYFLCAVVHYHSVKPVPMAAPLGYEYY